MNAATAIGLTPEERVQAAAVSFARASRRLDMLSRNAAWPLILEALDDLDQAREQVRIAIVDRWSNDLGWQDAGNLARIEGLA